MKKQQKHSRNWALVIIASIVIILNLALIVFYILYAKTFGWWNVITIPGAIFGVWTSARAIKDDESAWLMLDLIFPS